MPPVDSVIHHVRSQRVILDADLARIYGVQTFRFNEAVKRNQTRFPEDFRFQLSKEEAEALTSQTAIPKTPSGRGGRRTLPWVFTEHGALQAANILNSPHAVAMSVYVIRAFVRLREEVAAEARLSCSPLGFGRVLPDLACAIFWLDRASTGCTVSIIAKVGGDCSDWRTAELLFNYELPLVKRGACAATSDPKF